jgi:hypothetical protein
VGVQRLLVRGNSKLVID